MPMFSLKRKRLEDVVEQERQLATRTAVDAATAQEMSLAEQAYINAGRWFEENIAKDEKRKRRRSDIIAAFAGVLAFMAILALMLLTPLKTVETYLLRVDKSSAFLDVVPPASTVTSSEQKDDEFWLSAYVRFRENYNFSDNDALFSMVELLSYEDTFKEYKNFQLSTKGYMNVLGNNRQIRTEINNIIFLKREDGTGTAQVRMTKTVLDKNGMPDPQIKPAVWVSTMSYDYKNPAKKRGDQWLNPKGFGVLSYSPAQEVGRGHE
ncbi:virB8 family protein [Pseudomonas fragariae (ex Marin et al. 2024)]|uniref:virB8 family protein n=1 Tax=Pseudomonas fragariae (ex Marin et al. 2024) TaxID=3080056 RepID=UPI003F7B0181